MSRSTLILVLIAAAACGHPQAVPQQAPDGAWPASPFSSFPPVATAHLRVPSDGLSIVRKDRAAALRAWSRPGAPVLLDGVYPLPAGLDPTPVIVESAAAAKLDEFLDLVRELTSGPPPRFINVFLRTAEGAVGMPVFFHWKQAGQEIDDGRPHRWTYFWEHEISSPAWNPEWKVTGLLAHVANVRVAPLDNGDILVNVDSSLPDALQVLRVDAAPAVDVRAGTHEERLGALEEQAVELVGSLAARDRLRAAAPGDRREANFASGRTWRVVKGLGELDEVLTGIRGADRRLTWADRSLRVSIYPGAPRPTVQDYVRLLDLARKHRFAGAIVWRGAAR